MRVAAEVLRLAGEMVAPGVTTEAIDVYVHDLFIERGAYPSTINYHGYPKACCTSVNEVICHGIPDSRELQDGDICNIDVTGYIGGVHGDTNATFFVGDVDPESRQLVQVTEECTWYGIEAVRPGRPLSDIGRAIEDHAKKYRYGVVRAFVGHGIGEQFHGDIQVLHYYDSRSSTIMRPGMTFTIEPMITLGTRQLQDLGRRLDGGHRRRQAHRTVRAHDPRHRRRLRRAHGWAGCGEPVGSLEPLTPVATNNHHKRRVRRTRHRPTSANAVAKRSSHCGASVGMIAADSPSRRTKPQTASSTPTSNCAASATNVRPRRPGHEPDERPMPPR